MLTIRVLFLSVVGHSSIPTFNESFKASETSIIYSCLGAREES